MIPSKDSRVQRSIKKKRLIKNNNHNEWQTLLSISNIIFSLDANNISQRAKSLINIIDDTYPITFNMIIIQMTCSLFATKMHDINVYLKFLNEIEKHEEDKNIKYKIFDVFTIFIVNHTNESNFILKNLCEQDFIQHKLKKSFIPKSKLLNFFTYKQNKENKKTLFDIVTEELSKNDWELHKKLIREGVNPNEIAKIIRNDEVEKLQEISSQTNFDFNQTIKPSPYERYSFINHKNVTLIDYAAFFGSVKCFKYLLINGAKIENTGKYAIAGGNEEIIHICEQNHSSFENAYETAIQFHRNDIFHYLFENKIVEIENIEDLGIICIQHHNYDIFTYLQEKGMKIYVNFIVEAAKIGNLFLVQHFLNGKQIPYYLTNQYYVQAGNNELVEYILDKEDANIRENIIFHNFMF